MESLYKELSVRFAYRLGYAPEECDLIFQSLPHADLVDAIEVSG